jgi:2-polyprenyl-3-methyl-5-hydroxy-6-metoxy-1,4-benzoquinol methylase
MNQTITAYDKNALSYSDKFVNFSSYTEKIKKFRDSYVKENATLLDMGCGPGHNAAILSRVDNLKIIGFDLSREMVKLAKANAPGAEFHVKDINAFESGEPCDVVIASFCIVHLTQEETESLLEKISIILKPGGHLYLSFMEGKGQGFETTSFSEDEIFFNYYDRNYMRERLNHHNLELLEDFAEAYPEKDGAVTRAIFMFARRRA